MKIVHVSVSFKNPISPGKRGGGEISNLALFNGIVKTGDDVSVVSAWGNGLWGDKVDGVEYYDFSTFFNFLPKKIAIFISKILFRPMCFCFFKKNNADLIFVGPSEIQIGLAQKKICGTKVGAFVRAFENFPDNTKGLKYQFKRFIYGDFSKESVNLVDFIVTNSEFMESLCRKEFNVEKIYKIYPSVFMKEGDKGESVVESIKKVGMVSSRKDKGFEIFKHLAVCFPNIEFTVIGDRESDISDVPKNVVFTGWKENPKKTIDLMDMIVVPSQWNEPFGRIALEGILLNKIVIGSRVGGIPEVLMYKDELLCDPNEKNEWSEKLKLVLESPPYYFHICQDVKRFSERFSPDLQLRNFKYLIESLF